jgi:cytochrome c oxidase subunit 2
VLGALVVCASCSGVQSTLETGGSAASRISTLFWVMTALAAIIWAVVIALTVYATFFARTPMPRATGRKLIVGGGVVFPTITLTGLLIYGLWPLPALLRAAPPDAIRVEVIGHQWWWQVRYPRDGAPPVELANEIHLPVGRTVEFTLDGRDVIHSFWIPSLGGKMDMIPGRRTRLLLEPTRVGTYRGVCAEFCGTSHARMSFAVVVQSPEDFDRWLAEQATASATPSGTTAARGARVFAENGCGGCHQVRGTDAVGRIGPDLTHVGSRMTIGAGTLTRSMDSFVRFVSHTDRVKPGVLMPPFGMLPPADLEALATYLEGLK